MENNKLVNETGNVGSVPGLALSEAELRREIAISLAKAVLEVAEEAEKLEKKIPGRGYIAGALGAAAMALAPAPAQAGFVGSSARRAEAAESTRQYEQKKANNAQAAKWSQEAGGKDTIGPRTPAPSTPTPSKPHPSDHEGETNAIGAGVLGLAAGTLGALRRRSMTGQDSQFKLLPD
jgi:hypothetical protein